MKSEIDIDAFVPLVHALYEERKGLERGKEEAEARMMRAYEDLAAKLPALRGGSAELQEFADALRHRNFFSAWLKVVAADEASGQAIDSYLGARREVQRLVKEAEEAEKQLRHERAAAAGARKKLAEVEAEREREQAAATEVRKKLAKAEAELAREREQSAALSKQADGLREEQEEAMRQLKREREERRKLMEQVGKRERPPRKKDTARTRKPEPRPEPAPKPEPESEPETPSLGLSGEEEALASAFREWCARGGAMMSRATSFASHLRRQMDGATVRVMSRDMDSPALPFEFHESGATSPAEYWVVTQGSRHWLLPQPQNSSAFRELAPCFEGRAAPSALRAIKPGTLGLQGARLVLVAPGRVH